MLCYVLAALLAVLSPTLAAAKEPIRVIESATVTKVSDGDTIHAVTPEGTKLKVRLYGVDAPETEKSNKRTGRISKPGQPFGLEAQNLLQEKIGRKSVRLDVMAVDRYKRLVALVYLGQRNINREMVSEGAAWAYRQYLDRPYASELISVEGEARRYRRGLWQQSNPQPPREFRKKLRLFED